MQNLKKEGRRQRRARKRGVECPAAVREDHQPLYQMGIRYDLAFFASTLLTERRKRTTTFVAEDASQKQARMLARQGRTAEITLTLPMIED